MASEHTAQDKPQILIVDDDENLRRLVAAYLEHEGYDVAEAPDGETALRLIEEQPPDLILLDVMLPGTNGHEVCRRVARRHDVPILMLTALNSESDVLNGFEAGADDYLPKPFSPKVLVAHVRAILRRGRGIPEDDSEVIVHGDITMDMRMREVRINDRLIELTGREFDLLQVFVASPGWVFTREDLLERIWGYQFLGDSRIVDAHIGHLRRKIGDVPSNPAHIRTIRGYGYRLQPHSTTNTDTTRDAAHK
jgi:two-component system alkaline phosphatase synthesis response regulator PhoP